MLWNSKPPKANRWLATVFVNIHEINAELFQKYKELFRNSTRTLNLYINKTSTHFEAVLSYKIPLEKRGAWKTQATNVMWNCASVMGVEEEVGWVAESLEKCGMWRWWSKEKLHRTESSKSRMYITIVYSNIWNIFQFCSWNSAFLLYTTHWN